MAIRCPEPAQPSRRLSSRERVARDAMVVEMRARGAHWQEVADAVGLSERQARRIFKAWREDSTSSAVLDGEEALRSTLEMLRQAIADMARIEAKPESQNAHIGATRLKVEIAERLLLLLQLLGVLPRNLGSFALERQVRQMMSEFIDLLRRYDVPDELLQELQALAESRRGRDGLTAPAWTTHGEAEAA